MKERFSEEVDSRWIVLTLNSLLFIKNREPIQDGSVGVEDQQPHIRQCRQIQYVDQGFRRTGVELLLPQRRVKIALDLNQVIVSPGRADQLTPDAIAVWQGKGFKQQSGWLGVGIANSAFQVAQCFVSEVCGTDLPGSTVVSCVEAQTMDHGLGFFQGVQVTDVMSLIEHFASHGIDYLPHQPGGLETFFQFIRNGLAFADQGGVVIEHAGKQF